MTSGCSLSSLLAYVAEPPPDVSLGCLLGGPNSSLTNLSSLLGGGGGGGGVAGAAAPLVQTVAPRPFGCPPFPKHDDPVSGTVSVQPAGTGACSGTSAPPRQ